MRIPATLDCVTDIKDDRIAVLERSLRITAAVLQGEAERMAGAPFSGDWSVPVESWRGSVTDALDQANAVLGDTK